MRSVIRRALAPIVQLRDEEAVSALLMFVYSFLAMTSYNVIKPITRSKFIKSLGAEDLPLAQLAAGLLIGIVMQGYSRVVATMPRRWVIPVTQAGIVVILMAFWALFSTEQAWVAWGFYLFALIFGILVISQFWTLANDIYDPRQAKRLFGFIGGGAPLGGMAAGAITGYLTPVVGGTRNWLLVSGLTLAACAVIVWTIFGEQREASAARGAALKEEKGVGGRQALQLLRESKHLQIIALVISFAAIGAAVIEQQLNMAAQAFKGRDDLDALTAFLGQVTLWTSSIAFVLQIGLTSRIHRFLGIGFALLILPVGLGTTALVMLLNAALWAPTLARVLDQSVRYTVDKTSREILFLPLPTDLKYRAKPFVDVTVDRSAKALGALLVWVLIKPWGLHLTWQQVSYASLLLTVLWIFNALRARRGYLKAFRESLAQRQVEPERVTLNAADLSTIEMLVEELAHPDERRVLYAIDILESLDKRNLVTPLLLNHESATVRARALEALGAAKRDIAERWVPAIRRMVSDDSPDVRAAAVGALARIQHEQAVEFARPLLEDRDPRIQTTAAALLARSSREDDKLAAETTLTRLATDTDVKVRGDVATAIAQIGDARFRHLLLPLLHDPSTEVAEEAMRSVRRFDAADFMFVPALVSLLRHRRLKASAREVLIGYGEGVLDALGYFMGDPDEDLWVRRHIPATIARIPSQKAMDILVGALHDPDGFLRYKAVAAIEKLQREHTGLTFEREAVERLALREGNRYFRYLGLHYNLVDRARLSNDSLLARALGEKMARTVDRVYRLLSLLYEWKDVEAARWAIEHGDPRARASASEYLDNILTGNLRKRLMSVIEDLPRAEKVQKGNVLLKTRPRDVEETLLELINDEDAVISAAAVDLVRELGVWNLAPDLEHLLAHRDVRDWYVFEATSWALAAHRLPDRHRTLWIEALPAVEVAARLRKIPMFAAVSVDELFRIAGTGHQARHEAGRILYQEGAIPETAQFLLDGQVVLNTRDGDAREVEPTAPLGFQEVLTGLPMSETARTITTAVCLAVGRGECQTLLADNSELVEGLFRTIVEARPESRATVLRGQMPAMWTGLGLSPIEKVLAFERVPLFAGLSSDETLALASAAREVRLSAGSTLFNPADAPSITILLAGEAMLEADGAAALTARAGDALGVQETLAGLRLGCQARVTRDATALRLNHEELFDLLAHRPELMQQIFAALFGATQATVGSRQ